LFGDLAAETMGGEFDVFDAGFAHNGEGKGGEDSDPDGPGKQATCLITFPEIPAVEVSQAATAWPLWSVRWVPTVATATVSLSMTARLLSLSLAGVNRAALVGRVWPQPARLSAACRHQATTILTSSAISRHFPALHVLFRTHRALPPRKTEAVINRATQSA
jgi:hypothetical protein